MLWQQDARLHTVAACEGAVRIGALGSQVRAQGVAADGQPEGRHLHGQRPAVRGAQARDQQRVRRRQPTQTLRCSPHIHSYIHFKVLVVGVQ